MAVTTSNARQARGPRATTKPTTSSAGTAANRTNSELRGILWIAEPSAIAEQDEQEKADEIPANRARARAPFAKRQGRHVASTLRRRGTSDTCRSRPRARAPQDGIAAWHGSHGRMESVLGRDRAQRDFSRAPTAASDHRFTVREGGVKVDRLRVLRIIDRLNIGGPALQATVLSEGLDPARFDHRLLAGGIDADEGDHVTLRAPDLRVERIDGLGRSPHLGNDAQALWRISQVIRRFRPHIVHTHKAKAGVLGRVAAWSNRVPATVHHYHGHLLSGYFSPSKTKVFAGIERGFAHPTTALVAVGSQVRDELLAAGIGRREQYSVVPPGVVLPAAADRRAARAALGLPGDAPVVGYVGRLTQVKRPERFIDMAIEVARRHPTAVFLIAGRGELLGSLVERARPLEGRARFLGWRGDVATVYAASDVVVLTSDNEGMPVSLIEAASVGTPAVTTRVGSAPEVVLDGVTGFVTATDVEALVRATVELLENDDLRRRMGAAAALRARREFSAARLVADITALYERIAAEGALG